MNNLQIFENPEFGQMRTLCIDGEGWFVGKDAAESLGYAKARNAITVHVAEEDKKEAPVQGPLGGTQTMTIINESGLYSLILSSKLPSAKKFKIWVTREVLPAIRKTGGYIPGGPDLSEREILARAMMIAQKTMQENRRIIVQQSEKIEQDRPKVLFADAVSASDSTILVGQLAKLLQQNGVEIGQNRLFQWLREHSYLVKRKGEDYNLPTQRSIKQGLMKVKERLVLDPDGSNRLVRTAKITGKGQQYFVNLFLGKKNRHHQHGNG